MLIIQAAEAVAIVAGIILTAGLIIAVPVITYRALRYLARR